METFFSFCKKWLSGHRLLLNIVLAIFFITSAIFLRNPFAVRAVSYNLLREINKCQVYLKTWDWNTLRSNNFILKFEDEDALVAKLVMEIAEEIFEPINEALAYKPQEQVLMVMYPTKASLNKSFGWDADENAMGVYWAGTIRILSPLAWVDETESLATEFRAQGPIAHEYAHLVVDYMTKGNYTRWLTEGIAQYLERELTGFAFAAQAVEEKEQLYTFQQMTKEFDNLPDQSLAYYQSLAAIDYYVERYGFENLVSLLEDLGKGKSLSQTFLDNTGQSIESFEVQVQDYIIEKTVINQVS